MAGGNMVGFMSVALRTEIEDPVERLAAVHQESRLGQGLCRGAGPESGNGYH